MSKGLKGESYLSKERGLDQQRRKTLGFAHGFIRNQTSYKWWSSGHVIYIRRLLIISNWYDTLGLDIECWIPPKKYLIWVLLEKKAWSKKIGQRNLVRSRWGFQISWSQEGEAFIGVVRWLISKVASCWYQYDATVLWKENQ